MSLRTVGAALVLVVVAVTGGCHSESRYGSCYAQPSCCASPTPVVATPGCSTCNAPVPGTVPAAVPGFGH